MVDLPKATYPRSAGSRDQPKDRDQKPGGGIEHPRQRGQCTRTPERLRRISPSPVSLRLSTPPSSETLSAETRLAPCATQGTRLPRGARLPPTNVWRPALP